MDLTKLADKRKPGSAFRTVYDMTAKSDCLACGKCCKAINVLFISKLDPSFVDVKSFLDSKPASLPDIASYIDEIDFGISIKAKNERCHFLEQDNKCTIYKFRPNFCRTYPFIPVEKQVIRDSGFRDTIPLMFLSSYCPPVEEIKKAGFDFLFFEDIIVSSEKLLADPVAYGFDGSHPLLEQIKEKPLEFISTKLLGSSLTMLIRDLENGVYGDFDILLKTPEGQHIFPIK
ncbi:YkgJ family cysteine cluster protein [Candidatus Micrarchaeota archaeon]|nr:YkgJ family cysteine cluster protein [Candidatus Micrarchaeota archaeon]